MKRILKYFLDNLKMTVNLTSIILGFGFLIFSLFESIEFVLLIIIISVLLTLLDIFSNKSD